MRCRRTSAEETSRGSIRTNQTQSRTFQWRVRQGSNALTKGLRLGCWLQDTMLHTCGMLLQTIFGLGCPWVLLLRSWPY